MELKSHASGREAGGDGIEWGGVIKERIPWNLYLMHHGRAVRWIVSKTFIRLMQWCHRSNRFILPHCAAASAFQVPRSR